MSGEPGTARHWCCPLVSAQNWYDTGRVVGWVMSGPGVVGRYRALLVGNSTYPADEHNLQTLKGPG
jgi:hypothetical protein